MVFGHDCLRVIMFTPLILLAQGERFYFNVKSKSISVEYTGLIPFS